MAKKSGTKSGDVHPAILILLLALSVFSVWAFVNQVTKKPCTSSTSSTLSTSVSEHIKALIEHILNQQPEMFRQMTENKNLWNCITSAMKKDGQGKINKWYNTLKKYEIYSQKVEILTQNKSSLQNELDELKSKSEKLSTEEQKQLEKRKEKTDQKLVALKLANTQIKIDYKFMKENLNRKIDPCIKKTCCDGEKTLLKTCPNIGKLITCEQ